MKIQTLIAGHLAAALLAGILIPCRAGAQEYGNAELIRVLGDPSSPSAAKGKVLDQFLPFHPDDALALLRFAGREPDPDLRLLAAYRLHGMISYLEPSSPYLNAALGFVTNPETVAAVKKILLLDLNSSVRYRMIHFISTVMFPFERQAREPLGAMYIPLLLEALPDNEAQNRSDALFALMQFEGASALRASAVVSALQRRLGVEPDEDIRERIKEILAELGQGREPAVSGGQAPIKALETRLSLVQERILNSASEPGASRFWDGSGAPAAAAVEPALLQSAGPGGLVHAARSSPRVFLPTSPRVSLVVRRTAPSGGTPFYLHRWR